MIDSMGSHLPFCLFYLLLRCGISPFVTA
jgi:hypothetical protein